MGFWEQLPYTNFHDLNLTELVKFVNETIKKINEMSANIVEQNQTIQDFKDYVINYLENLDVESDVINYINQLIDDGVITDQIKLALNTLGDWSNRNIIFVGDSYGRGRTYPNTYGTSWCEQVAYSLSPNSYYNLSVSQASWADVQPEALRFGKQLYDFVGSHSTSVCEGITDIVICGGYNELFAPSNDIVNTTADYCAKWTSNYIKTNFPNARVFIGFIGRVPIFGGSQATFQNLETCIAKYKAIARSYGWKYLNNSEYMSHIYHELTDDGIHFKTSGYIEIGRRIANAMNDGAWTPPQTNGEIIPITPMPDTSSNSVVITNTPDIYYHNSNCAINIFVIAALNFIFSQTSITFADDIKLGYWYDKANEKYPDFIPQYNKRFPVVFNVYDGGTRVQTGVHGYLIFKDDGRLLLGNIDGHSYTGNATQIYIAPLNITLPYSMC